jgi:hypothetical protein
MVKVPGKLPVGNFTPVLVLLYTAKTVLFIPFPVTFCTLKLEPRHSTLCLPLPGMSSHWFILVLLNDAAVYLA